MSEENTKETVTSAPTTKERLDLLEKKVAALAELTPTIDHNCDFWEKHENQKDQES